MTAGRPIRSSVSLIPRNPGGRKSPVWRASSRRQSNATLPEPIASEATRRSSTLASDRCTRSRRRTTRRRLISRMSTHDARRRDGTNTFTAFNTGGRSHGHRLVLRVAFLAVKNRSSLFSPQLFFKRRRRWLLLPIAPLHQTGNRK